MNKSLKGIAITAAALVTAGLLFTGIGFLLGGNQPIWLDRDGIHLGRQNDEKTTGGDLAAFSEDIGSFSSIRVDLDYYDVDLVPGDKFAIEGTYYRKEGKPEIEVKNGTLTVADNGKKGINLSIDLPGLLTYDNHPDIRIFYPEKTEFQSVVIHCDASDLKFENLAADQADFKLDFGKLELSDITAGKITVSMDSGDCSIKEIKASEELTVTNDFGKVVLENAETKTLQIDADSGNVILTDTVFDSADLNVDLGKLTAKGIKSKGLKVTADSGDVTVEGELSGITDVKNNMGSVAVRPGGPQDQFSYELNTDLGSVSVDGKNTAGSIAFSTPSTENMIKVSAEMGSINLNFN